MRVLAEKVYSYLEGTDILKYIIICGYLNKYPKSKLAKDLLYVWEENNKRR